jgi:hypothetical protein
MRKVIRGYAKDKNLNLILIGTIPVPHSKGKRSPVARQDKRYLVSRAEIALMFPNSRGTDARSPGRAAVEQTR